MEEKADRRAASAAARPAVSRDGPAPAIASPPISPFATHDAPPQVTEPAGPSHGRSSPPGARLPPLPRCRVACAGSIQDSGSPQPAAVSADCDARLVASPRKASPLGAPYHSIHYRRASPGQPLSSAEFSAKFGGIVDELVTDQLLQPGTSCGDQPEYGGAAQTVIDAASPESSASMPSLIESEAAAAGPTLPAEARRSTDAPSPTQPLDRTGSRKPTPPLRQQSFWLRFTDVGVEERFRLWQAVILRPVDVKASLVIILGILLLGWSPAFRKRSMFVNCALTLPAPLTRIILAAQPRTKWYLAHRETIGIVAWLLNTVVGLFIVLPSTLPPVDVSSLRGFLTWHHFSSCEQLMLLPYFYKVRFWLWLPFQLLCCALAILSLPRMGAWYEAAGAASAVSVMLAGGAWHLTAGLAVPAACLWSIERWERLRFAHQSIKKS